MNASLEDMFVLANSALAHWPEITSEPSLVMHRENTVFRVETMSGPAALRLHRADYHSRAAIRSELDWMAYLMKNGFAVPAPFPTRSGDLAVELADASGSLRVIDLLTWLDGEPLGASYQPFTRPPLQTCAIFHNIGAELAKLHTLSDQWALPQNFKRHAWDRNGLIGDNPFWGPFWSIADISSQATNMLLLIRDRVRQDLDDRMAGGLDYGLIHADLARENVLVAGTDVRMIDFDDAGFGFRMFDIATALIKNRREPNYREIEAALIAGYQSQRPLSQRELEARPLFTLLRSLTYLGWAETRSHEPCMEYRRRRFVTEALELCQAYLDAG